ncbi:MAG: DNA-binding transcriptional regulator OxyR [Gammaproteobacteria bacterium RIFCSPHIGHO2_12_FULL_40_19]|nr:MAG: DNA-binding transcriptional regulator OxyR [Gammaproteobacteria bacterium RIFCSPHIGHO2_12_FULL_40_19]
MNIRDLQYLVALADYRHFGKAADSCFVSQPALSMQIKKLEKHLGIQLLERTNKSVMLTPTGAILAERARLILNQVNELREIAKSAKDPFSGELTIGIIPTLAPYLLPHIIPKLSAAFPKLEIYLIEEQTAFLIEKLKQGKLDTAILALPISESVFTISPLFEEEFMLALAPTHALAKRKTIKQSDLQNTNLVLLEEGHCLREQALAICHMVNAQENKNFRATSLETLRHMIAAGVGSTLIPLLACQPDDGICYVPFSKPKPFRTIGMLWRTASTKVIVLNDIATHVRKIMAKYSELKIIQKA